MGESLAIAIILSMEYADKYLRPFMMFCILTLLVACGVQPDISPTVPWTPLPVASNGPLPTATPIPAPSAPITSSTNCVNDAGFLEDLTIPDQTVVDPGAELDKRWSVQNRGSCDWGPGYHLLHISNDAFSTMDEIALYPASAGSMAVWQVQLVAPLDPGEHISIWQARAPDGALFGEQVYLWVVVATPMASPTSRGTPTN